jgi:hypothetical protein
MLRLRKAAVTSGSCQNESGITIRSLARPGICGLFPPPDGVHAFTWRY